MYSSKMITVLGLWLVAACSGVLGYTSPELFYPAAAQTGVESTIEWVNGSAPFSLWILNAIDKETTYFKYQGNERQVSWMVNITAGTEVIYRLVDMSDTAITTDAAFIVGKLAFTTVPSGTIPEAQNSVTLAWTGGSPYYSVYVESSSDTKIGSVPVVVSNTTSYTWSINRQSNLTPQMFFKVVDGSGFSISSAAVTIAGVSGLSSSGGLSKGAQAGLGVGLAVLALLLGGAAFYYVRRRRAAGASIVPFGKHHKRNRSGLDNVEKHPYIRQGSQMNLSMNSLKKKNPNNNKPVAEDPFADSNKMAAGEQNGQEEDLEHQGLPELHNRG